MKPLAMNCMYRKSLLCLVLLASTSCLGEDYLDATLRSEVDTLIKDVEREATNAQNVHDRAHLLWRWTNAWALDDRYVPVNLTTAFSAILGYPAPTRPSQHALIDMYIKELAFVDADATVLGRLVALGGPFEAISYGTLTQVFTVGSADIKPGGGLLIGRHFMAGYQLQTSDPTAPDYTTISSTNPNVTFVVDSHPLRGMHGGFRGATGALVFRVEGSSLTAGDVVTVTYGDTTKGGEGMRMPDIGTDFMVFPIYVAFDSNDHYISLPLQPVSITGTDLEGVHAFAPSIVKTGQPFEISIRARDHFYNRPKDPSPRWILNLNDEAAFVTEPTESAISLVSLSDGLAKPGVYYVSVESEDGSIRGIGNPILVEDEPTRYIYWGDTHGHSGFAEGLGTPDSFMRWAKEDARLDYVTHSEHDIWMDDREWLVLIDNVVSFSDEQFIGFLGYEWTRSKFLGGHHNVIFRTAEGRERVPAQLYGTLTRLYQGLRDKHDPQDVVVIPHAHQPGNYRHSDPDLEPLVEIMSQHGTFEWFGQKYLDHGHEVGFTAASDNHLSQPGYTAPKAGGLSQRGGLGALLATEKTRDSLFDAMKQLDAYATSGDRIILDFTLNGSRMGKRIAFSEQRALKGRVIGAWPVAEIAVIKNGEEIWHKDYIAATGDFTPSRYKLSFGSDSEPLHEHDNPRGWKHWSGSFTVNNARLVSAEPMDFSNTQSHRFVVDEDGVVHFSTLTRGEESSIDLVLDDIQADATVDISLNAGQEYGGGPPTFRPHQAFEATTISIKLPSREESSTHAHVPMQDYTDYVKIRAIIEEGIKDVSFELIDSGSTHGDYYYFRAVMANDAMAWSSPIWVGGYKTL